MANLGVGVSPAGVGPFGIGTPALAIQPTGKALQGAGGAQYGSRKISTAADSFGQYVIDADGNVTGDRDVRQMVILAARTILGSSVVAGLGGTFSEIRKIGDDFKSLMTSKIQAAFSDLAKAQMISIDSIEITEFDGGRTFTRVFITDLTTKQQFSVSI